LFRVGASTVVENTLALPSNVSSTVGNTLALPSKVQATVRGHKGVCREGLLLSNSLVGWAGGGTWSELNALVEQNPCLGVLRDQLAESLTMSKASSTIKAYKSPVDEWQGFCVGINQVGFPVDTATFLLFLQMRLNYDKERKNKVGGLLNRVYGVDLMCNMLGYEGPGKQPQVLLLLESGRKQLGRPTIKKKACDKDLLMRLIAALIPDCTLQGQNLCDLRTAVFCLLGFVLEGRWAEVSQLCSHDFTDYGTHMVAFIEVRKCDQHREGSFVPFTDSKEPRGACSLLRAFLSMIPPGHDNVPIFRHLDRGKVNGWFWRGRSISYTRMSELVKKAIKSIGVDSSLFGLHSFRSGAATEIGKDPSIDGRLHARHGGWAAGSTSKDGYIEESEENLMRIPLHLSV
jgi:hypothetical protein